MNDEVRKSIEEFINSIFAPLEEFANSVLEEASKGVKELEGLLDSDSINDQE